MIHGEYVFTASPDVIQRIIRLSPITLMAIRFINELLVLVASICPELLFISLQLQQPKTCYNRRQKTCLQYNYMVRILITGSLLVRVCVKINQEHTAKKQLSQVRFIFSPQQYIQHARVVPSDLKTKTRYKLFIYAKQKRICNLHGDLLKESRRHICRVNTEQIIMIPCYASYEIS